MIAMPVGRHVWSRTSRPRNYCIQLKISPADREDAWELCRVMQEYGGVEVGEGCFAFANAERWLAASESLRCQFGFDYFEAIDVPELRTTEV